MTFLMIYLSHTSWEETGLNTEKSRNTEVSRGVTATKPARDRGMLVISHGVRDGGYAEAWCKRWGGKGAEAW